MLLRACARSRQAKLLDDVERKQRCYEEGDQHTDNRSHRVAPLRGITRSEPPAPTALVAAVGLVGGQRLDQLLPEAPRV